MLLTNFHFFSFLQQILFTTKFFLFSQEVPYQAKSLGYYTKYLLKKIVALALCLVLALSLCATAFAASTSTELKAKDFSLLSKDNTTSTDLDKVVKTVQDPTSVTDKDGKTTTTYYADKYEITEKGGSSATTYYAVDSSVNYTIKLVSGGKVVAYLLNTTEVKAEDTATAMVKTTKKLADVKCGEYKVDKDTTLYTVDGKVYPAGTDKWVRYNGSFVMISNTEVDYEEHTFDLTKYTFDKDTYTSVYCSKCEKYVPVVKTADIAASDTSKYKTVTISGVDYSYKVGAVAGSTPTTSGSKVDSAKTFDAGIALYVGMSISAVAGSAVVIGKKKEF